MKRVIVFLLIFLALLYAVVSAGTDEYKGNVNGVVIFVRFADQTEFQQRPRLWYNRFNYTLSPNYISVKNYFKETSYDSVSMHHYLRPNPTSDSSSMMSYQDPHILNYYVGAINGNDSGYDTSSILQEWVPREQQLVQNAVNAVASQIPPSVDVDSDNDGLVDLVLIITRGPDTSRILHGHAHSLSTSYPAYINGARVSGDSMQMEDYFVDPWAPDPDTTVRYISVVVHESLHLFGAEDMYHAPHVGGDGTVDPLGRFSPMINAMNPPQHTTMYEKWHHLQWIDDIPYCPSGRNWLFPITSRQDPAAGINTAYRIDLANPDNEYFVLELRNGRNTWESQLHDSGLCVYRINPNYSGNATGPPDEVYVYRDGGTVDEQHGNIYRSTFSIDWDKPAFNVTTDPKPWMTDSSIAHLFIADVGPIDDSIDFFYTWDYSPYAGAVSGTWDTQDPGNFFAYWVYLNCYANSGTTLSINPGSHVYVEAGKYLRGDGLVQFNSGSLWTNFFSLGQYRTGIKSKGDIRLTNGGQIKLY